MPKAEHFWILPARIWARSASRFIRYLGPDDPTTRIAMEQTMAKEEEHADDMKKRFATLSLEMFSK